jgi:hypothetical protein
MDPIDKHFKSLINTKSEDGTIEVKLHVGEIIAIIECLSFANRTAKYLSEAELKKGTQYGVRSMTKIQRDSNELVNILADHLEIGQPDSKEIN